jgi:hypothetical protein
MLLKIIYKIIRPSIFGFNWYIENKYKCTVTIEFKFEFKNLKGREKRKYKKEKKTSYGPLALNSAHLGTPSPTRPNSQSTTRALASSLLTDGAHASD